MTCRNPGYIVFEEVLSKPGVMCRDGDIILDWNLPQPK
jgi:hypothetical protein